jgi:cytochrome c553
VIAAAASLHDRTASKRSTAHADWQRSTSLSGKRVRYEATYKQTTESDHFCRSRSRRSDGSGTARLKSVYTKQCSSCPGQSAQGDAKKLIPQIAGQHYEYLMRQIYDAVDGRRPNFSTSHVRLLARLQRDDTVGLADYLSRMPLRNESKVLLEINAGVSARDMRGMRR